MIQQLSAFRRVVKKFADKMMMITVNRRRAATLAGKPILMWMPMLAYPMTVMIMAMIVMMVPMFLMSGIPVAIN
ncbi:MAG TPA: hypothetical protein PKC25_02955 [Candidatus Rifleibacterium sp.]|nr:hypothetical protein [Candidatus Rifleibacterium sp.]